jgi:hypothetical protein
MQPGIEQSNAEVCGRKETALRVVACDRQEKCDPRARKKLIHQRQEKSDIPRPDLLSFTLYQ